VVVLADACLGRVGAAVAKLPTKDRSAKIAVDLDVYISAEF